MKIKLIAFSILAFGLAFGIFGISSAIAASTVISPDGSGIMGPWMTGPLLAPAGHTVPKGHLDVEPYLFVTDDNGAFNNRWKATDSPAATNISPTLILSYGLTNWMDIQLTAPYDFKEKKGQHTNGVSDTGVTLGFQALNGRMGTWMPDLRLTIEETFPTGKYENLNPAKLGIDGNGAGSYQSTFGANFQKMFKFENGKYLRMRLTFAYTIPASTDVNNFNSYGGGFGTRGSVKPGNIFSTDLGFEYTLTQNWVPALDVVFTTAQATTFRGIRGVTTSGLPATLGKGSSDSISLAPAIEYNFSSRIGIIVGTWFAVRGRNTGKFVSGVGAVNFYF